MFGGIGVYFILGFKPYKHTYKTNLCRGKLLHTRDQHLRNHRGFSVACSNGYALAFSDIISLFSGISQRIVTCPVDLYCNRPMDCQWHFPTYFVTYQWYCSKGLSLVQWTCTRIVLWIVSGMFQHNLSLISGFVPKDCHLSSGLVLELSSGFQWHFPT